jgi:hypothetical protein
VNRATRRAFDQAITALIAEFERTGPYPGQEATPPLLAEAVRECLETCQRIDAEEDEPPLEEIDELATHALEYLSDLGLWAWQLRLDEARAAIEDLALELAQWIFIHGGQITVLEPIVNALARQANASNDPAALRKLFDRACAIIAQAVPEHAESGDMTALQPWLTLHFNCAIIATRTQQPELMNAAFDLLETHLPQHCPAFYAEGVRESAKSTYGQQVGEIMRERLAKWTASH